jgi:hypothetical protein
MDLTGDELNAASGAPPSLWRVYSRRLDCLSTLFWKKYHDFFSLPPNLWPDWAQSRLATPFSPFQTHFAVGFPRPAFGAKRFAGVLRGGVMGDRPFKRICESRDVDAPSSARHEGLRAQGIMAAAREGKAPAG